MNSDLLYYITNHSGSLTLQEILVNLAAAVIVGGIIFLSYRLSHSGAVYSAKFNATIWMLTVVTTMVMCVIGNNIALSLGMVGALSIVRFRTAIKDARDTAYIFWCIAAGICCGVADFMIAIVGSTVLMLLMLLIGGMQANTRYLLIIRVVQKDPDEKEEAKAAVVKLMQDTYRGKTRLCVLNEARQSCEYIYELSAKQAALYNRNNVSASLLAVNGVCEANLVGQNDEITA